MILNQHNLVNILKESGRSKPKVSSPFLFHLAAGVRENREKNERKFWVLLVNGASVEEARERIIRILFRSSVKSDAFLFFRLTFKKPIT